jgi:hypothetical protein
MSLIHCVIVRRFCYYVAVKVADLMSNETLRLALVEFFTNISARRINFLDISTICT